jgi:hypothetical protein
MQKNCLIMNSELVKILTAHPHYDTLNLLPEGTEIKYENLMWNLKVHHCVHKIPQLVTILSQRHLVHTFPPYFPKIHSVLSSHLCLRLLNGLFPSILLNKILYEFLISVHATCFTHLNLDLIALIIFREV